MNAADKFARARAIVSSQIDRQARRAKAEIHAMVIRDRRSLGQTVRWINYRLGNAK